MTHPRITGPGALERLQRALSATPSISAAVAYATEDDFLQLRGSLRIDGAAAARGRGGTGQNLAL